MNSLQHIEEDGDDAGVNHVGEHSTDDGNYEEGFDGIVVLVAYSTHVSHGIGCSAKSEAADSSTEDGGIVVAT